MARAGNEPMTEEQILAATVGERRVHDGPVHLAEYDPSWPERFDREAERIAVALGERALMIEHVGSTSVPGLAAKPTIDILLIVADSADEDLSAGAGGRRVRAPDPRAGLGRAPHGRRPRRERPGPRAV